jgi:hypothetical protein
MPISRKSKYNLEVYSILSDIIANRSVEADMTKNFICMLYQEDRNNIGVRDNGMDPFEIWQKLHYTAYDELVVPMILNRLISNNKDKGFVTYNLETRKVSLTEGGRKWTLVNC